MKKVLLSLSLILAVLAPALAHAADVVVPGEVPASRAINTTSPLGGGGELSADRTLTCVTCEVTTNKDAANDYAGLTASSKLNAAQGQEVWGVSDLSDFASKSGTGTAALGATITSPLTDDLLKWGGSKWVNSTLTDSQVPDTITLTNITQIGTRPHSSLTGLTADDHTVYALLGEAADRPSSAGQAQLMR